MSRFDVQVGDGSGGLVPLALARSKDGQLLYSERNAKLFRPTVQVGEATYASYDPETQFVYSQDDLGGGVGQRLQALSTEDGYKRIRYANGLDHGSYGILPGPGSTTISKLTNMGSLTGAFELGGYLYLIGTRIIAKYDHDAGTISEAEDLGSGVTGFSGATFFKDGTEASDQTSTSTGATDSIAGPEDQIAEKITPAASKDLGRVDLQLVRVDVAPIQNVVISATGGTFTLTYGANTTGAQAYNVSAANLQTALRALAGLGSVTVTAVAGLTYQVVMTGVVGPGLLLTGDPAGLTGSNQTVTVSSVRVGATVSGNVELAVQADYNGRPSGADLAVATVPASTLATSAGTVTFRFDDNDRYFQESGVPYWLVLRASGTTDTATVGWTRTTSGDQNGRTSSDYGNSWTAAYKHYHTTYSKALTATSWVGKAATAKFLTTTDGATFTADSVYEGKHFVVHGPYLIRDCRASSAGAVSYSTDGANWSEPIIVGDPTIQITALLSLTSCLVVVKEDSIWVLDFGATTLRPEPVYFGGKSTTNGPGACVWRGVYAFIPFDGKLLSLTGDPSNGFDIVQSMGPDSAAEWEAPWGAGRVVAVAGDRQCLYVALSTSTSYKLFKSYEPTEKKWIGAIADLGTPTTFNLMYVFDRGGTNSPLLFHSTDSDNLGRITCARTPNPWADASYQVTTTEGTLRYPAATANMPASPKAWSAETFTFRQTAASGYAEMMWDNQDGAGYRAMEGGRVYDTGIVSYAAGLSSRLLDRELRMKAGSATAYPVLLVAALTCAVRPSQALKEFTFTVQVKNGMSGRALGDLLGVDHAKASALLSGAPMAGGTRTMLDPDEVEHQVLFKSVNRVIAERAVEGHSYFEITAVGE